MANSGAILPREWVNIAAPGNSVCGHSIFLPHAVKTSKVMSESGKKKQYPGTFLPYAPTKYAASGKSWTKSLIYILARRNFSTNGGWGKKPDVGGNMYHARG